MALLSGCVDLKLMRTANVQSTVVGFKLSGPFKFFFDVINVRMTFLDVKDPIK